MAIAPKTYSGYPVGLYKLEKEAVKIRINPNTMAQVYKIVQPGEVAEVLSQTVNMNGVWGFQQVKGGHMAVHGGNWRLKELPVAEPPQPEPKTRDEIIRLVGKL